MAIDSMQLNEGKIIQERNGDINLYIGNIKTHTLKADSTPKPKEGEEPKPTTFRFVQVGQIPNAPPLGSDVIFFKPDEA